MRKFLPSILILLIVVNLFAPFTVGINKNGSPSIKKSITEATDTVGIFIEGGISNTDTTATVSAKVTWYIDDSKTTDTISVLIQKAGDTNVTKTDLTVTTDSAATQIYRSNHPSDPLPYTVQTGNLVLPNLSPSTNYKISIVATQKIGFWGAPITYIFNSITLGSNSDAAYLNFNITTNQAGNTTETSGGTKSSISIDALMPPCSVIGGNGTITGCAAQLLYYVLFIPTSYLFALTGQFFDFTFSYSVKDSSYESSFVLGGWGIVRDFCNIFFIFVLLYIAFRTILGMSGGHGPNTKQMIINVVIIGLLINFSLFATQVIIDASNILARVFYNSNTIVIKSGGSNGVTENTPGLVVGPNGEIPLSAAIVNKVNPQNLIINGANNMSVEDTVSGQKVTDATIRGGNLGAGAFIILVLLAIAVNVTGIIVFISVGLIFISRVIGLWLAMIFAPLAFFSYAAPGMSEIPSIGWKHWWPETIKLAFLAPIFIFFVYLILQFLETGLGLIDLSNKTGVAFIIATIIPFIFIMVLLLQAKGIAKTLSGKLGQSITGGVAAVGGLALGGAALGAAALGRNTLGAFMKGGATGDTAGQRARDGTSKNMYDNLKGKLFNVTGVDALQRGIGRRIDRDQKNVEKGEHARKTLNDTAQARYHKNYGDLTMTERGNVHDTIDRDLVSRQQYGNKKYSQLTNAQQTIVNNMVTAQRAAPGGIAHGAAETVRDSKTKQSLGSKVLQSTRTGSYDIRNMSKIETKEHDTVASKFASGTTSFLANQMRGVFKQSNINYGTGQKDFLKDLGNTITDALKSTAVKVDLSHVGEEKKEDGHGGHH